jgi:hypothetical protein
LNKDHTLTGGAAIAALELLPQVPPYLPRYASFLFSFLGRGICWFTSVLSRKEVANFLQFISSSAALSLGHIPCGSLLGSLLRLSEWAIVPLNLCPRSNHRQTCEMAMLAGVLSRSRLVDARHLVHRRNHPMSLPGPIVKELLFRRKARYRGGVWRARKMEMSSKQAELAVSCAKDRSLSQVRKSLSENQTGTVETGCLRPTGSGMAYGSGMARAVSGSESRLIQV